MSKIPQGEWNAIAARYQGGESISKIARSYGCTPPAIHYILKRNRGKPDETLAPVAASRPTEAMRFGLVRTNMSEQQPAPVQNRDTAPNGAAGRPLPQADVADLAPAALSPGEKLADAGRPGMLRLNTPEPAQSFAPPASPATATPGVVSVSPSAAGNRKEERGEPPSVERTRDPRVTKGLDIELYSRAEAAIELFRSSFNAAMAEGSPGVCERLRQAATDLMRVAARTTMVLDRLNASGERSASRAHNYPRSAHAGEEFAKFR